MAQVDFTRTYSPAECTRGSWAPIDSSTLVGLPSASRGRYTQLNYIIGSEPGALSLALSGGNVILPVSSVNIDEPLQIENDPLQDFVVTENYKDTTVYSSIVVPATSVATVNFAPSITLLEIFNTNDTLPVYVGFNNVGLSTLSAQALPLLAESYYSIEREISTVYVGNTDASNNIDVRVIGHYTA